MEFMETDEFDKLPIFEKKKILEKEQEQKQKLAEMLTIRVEPEREVFSLLTEDEEEELPMFSEKMHRYFENEEDEKQLKAIWDQPWFVPMRDKYLLNVEKILFDSKEYEEEFMKTIETTFKEDNLSVNLLNDEIDENDLIKRYRKLYQTSKKRLEKIDAEIAKIVL